MPGLELCPLRPTYTIRDVRQLDSRIVKQPIGQHELSDAMAGFAAGSFGFRSKSDVLGGGHGQYGNDHETDAGLA